jgi:hypothetical protein
MEYNNLAESILLAPAKSGANHLCILTKSATPNMVSWLLLNYIKKMKSSIVKVELMIDATTEGVSVSAHESFRELHSIIPSFVCSYIYEPVTVTTNLYIWLNDETPISAYAGTAMFEQGDFLARANGSLSLCNSASAWTQFQSAVGSSIYCHHAEVEEHVRIFQAPAVDSVRNKSFFGGQSDEVLLSLVTKRTGEPGIHSGLNWGQRKGRNPNQAYIPLPIEIARSGFFPTDPIDTPPHFSVMTDDKRQLILRIEQQNQKAIATPLSNAQLGEYFRNRLSLANGAKVTRADLERYGRIDVKFVKIDSEHYYMDFSV